MLGSEHLVYTSGNSFSLPAQVFSSHVASSPSHTGLQGNDAWRAQTKLLADDSPSATFLNVFLIHAPCRPDVSCIEGHDPEECKGWKMSVWGTNMKSIYGNSTGWKWFPGCISRWAFDCVYTLLSTYTGHWQHLCRLERR